MIHQLDLDINAADEEGFTALMLASEGGHERGSFPSITNSFLIIRKTCFV